MLDPAPVRERFDTLPHDLSAYARENTGPSSWSAQLDDEALSAWAHDPISATMTDLLAGISPDDVPRVVMAAEDVSLVVTHRDAFVVASIDGTSTLGELVDVVDLPTSEVLEIVCRLAVLGVVVLDRRDGASRPRAAYDGPATAA